MTGSHQTPACLVLCCKAPHRSKRRLAMQIGTRAAAAAEHLLACALEDLESWPGDAVIAPASDGDADWFRDRFGQKIGMVVQRDGSLGSRINHLDATLRSSGRSRLIFIGADCPDLDLDYLTAADKALYNDDAVIGPARDGGVVLMGARRPWPPIGDLAWSTPELREQLCARLRLQDLSVARLEMLSDVDTIEDLTMVCEGLYEDDRIARRALVDWLRSDASPAVATS